MQHIFFLVETYHSWKLKLINYKLFFKCQLCIFFNRDEDNPQEETPNEEPAKEVKRSAWSRPQRKTHRGGGGGPKNKRGPTNKPPKTQQTTAAAKSSPAVESKPIEKKELDSDAADSGEESDADEKEDPSSEDDKKVSSVEDDDVEWEKFQQKLNKREKLEGKSKVSHSVHCPNFPEDKQEYWWTYICDRKSRTLLTAPYHVTNLVDTEEIQLKFTAPRWPGVYIFTVCLRSGKKETKLPKIIAIH